MTALDVGCGMGFFTIPLARLVGDAGGVIALDLQPEMLAGLARRASAAGCANIVAQPARSTSLDIDAWAGAVDFVLIFYMLHEVPDQSRLISQVYAALKPGGTILFAEPIVHVARRDFDRSLELLVEAGLSVIARPGIPISRAVVLRKPAAR